MASAPQTDLPLFYTDLTPLNSRDHGDWNGRTTSHAPWLASEHAIPLTVDEFTQAQRHFPIVFSSGDNPVPLALMGLNQGVNAFVDADGKIADNLYLPAYIRRYPFLLAKLQPNDNTLSLCFDPTCDLLGEFDEGSPLFTDGEPSEHTKSLLDFCQRFEEAGQRTAAFVEELKKHDLLMEGEVAIGNNEQPDRPFVYRGFQMVNQEKLRDLRGDQLRGWNQNGLLPLIFGHLFSLELMRDVFARQVAQGTAPMQQPADAPGPLAAN